MCVDMVVCGVIVEIGREKSHPHKASTTRDTAMQQFVDAIPNHHRAIYGNDCTNAFKLAKFGVPRPVTGSYGQGTQQDRTILRATNQLHNEIPNGQRTQPADA
jgi:hypothetical protein